jgi:5-methyltetrahydrofolate--homocysteine methyltransferase
VTATYAEQAKALAEGGVDLLLIETMFAFDETDAAFAGARSVTDLPIVVSFSYDRGVRTMMGVKPKDVVKKYSGKRRGAGGRQLRHHPGKHGKDHHRIRRDRAGLPAVGQAQCRPAAHGRGDRNRRIRLTPEEMGAYAKKYVALGARVVGGCCGSTPAHVAGIVKAGRTKE